MREIPFLTFTKGTLFIFALAVVMRFLYFPENIYFGYDQAREAFNAISIYKDFDLKIVGPSTEREGLFHGPLIWYLEGPFYLLGKGDPAYPAAFLLILNALGAFVIFWIGKFLFEWRVGLVASLIYAFSFGQTQYAMFFTAPNPAVPAIMFFYGGLALFIFKKVWWGIPLSAFFLGIAIQSEFFLIYQSLVFLTILVLWRGQLKGILKFRGFFISGLAICLSLSTFIMSEIRYGPRTISALLNTAADASSGQQHSTNKLSLIVSKYFESLVREFKDNIFAFGDGKLLFVLLIGLFLFALYRSKEDWGKGLFLLVWFFSSSVVYVFGIPNLYYFNIGISSGLILIVAYTLLFVWQRARELALVFIVLVAASNITLIVRQNPKGIINDIYVQEGMLLEREKKVIDYIYLEASGGPISVGALTMPLKINTTWAYLFSWYGKARYGYLPYWTEASALGYAGHGVLPRWESQEEAIHFSIIEPTRGVRQPFVDQFLEGERQYGEIIEEKIFGEGEQARLVVQKRGKL